MKPRAAAVARRRSTDDEPPVPPALLIERRKSAIHGRGIYARVAIPAFHVIIEYRGERVTKAESARREDARQARERRGQPACTYLCRLDDRHDIDARHGGNLSRFINHSCRPNCRMDVRRGRLWITAIADILPGEELTFDYGFPFRDRASNPCRCGAPECPGVIVAADQRWRLRRVERPTGPAR
ncbi:MAG: SET domain-containing protein-lysine N-methyltransferase [Opitutaceae bacterium]